MFEEFGKQKEMKPERLALIERAKGFLADMRAQDLMPTLRQLYYQMAQANVIENSYRSYKNFGELIGDGRLHGLIAWNEIEDRNRTVHKVYANEDPARALDGVEWSMVVDLWARQPAYVECWVEKDAQIQIVGRACDRLRVTYMACKGYLSLTHGHSAGERYAEAIDRGQHCVLLYLGDHDPSGMNMADVNLEKLSMFARAEELGVEIELRRLALNMDQIIQYNPPPQPAKTKDSRAKGYIAEHGDKSWELDALHPSVVDTLITNAINEYRDEQKWQDDLDEEGDLQADLVKLRENWPDVKTFLDTLP